MKVEVEICRMADDESHVVGQLVYHNHELLRVEGCTRKAKNGFYKVKFRRVGKINLDREMREAERREYGSLT